MSADIKYTADDCWNLALINGGDVDLRKRESSAFVTKRAFERIGRDVLGTYYYGKHFFVTTYADIRAIEGAITEQERKKWQMDFPDTLVFERPIPETQGYLRLLEVVRFGDVNLGGYFRLVDQLRGFAHMVDYLRHDDSRRGIKVLRQALGPWVQRLEVPHEVGYRYVTPKGDKVGEIPTTLDGIYNIKHTEVPISSADLSYRIEEFRLNFGIRNR